MTATAHSPVLKEKIGEKIGTGRRKTAVATVRLREGSGKATVNGRPLEEYFPLPLQVTTALEPINKMSERNRYDICIRVKGGGIEAQAAAVRLGAARALVVEDETRRPVLRAEGFLTRDPRKKERKKYGRRKARKRFQFSKR